MEDRITSPEARKLQNRLILRSILALLAALAMSLGLEVLWPGRGIGVAGWVMAFLLIPQWAMRAYRKRFPRALPLPAAP